MKSYKSLTGVIHSSIFTHAEKTFWNAPPYMHMHKSIACGICLIYALALVLWSHPLSLQMRWAAPLSPIHFGDNPNVFLLCLRRANPSHTQTKHLHMLHLSPTGANIYVKYLICFPFILHGYLISLTSHWTQHLTGLQADSIISVWLVVNVRTCCSQHFVQRKSTILLLLHWSSCNAFETKIQ